MTTCRRCWGRTVRCAFFTQRERDGESGLDYLLTRYCSSAQGRFTSPDEPLLGQREVDPQSWSLYGYARNNPLIYIDPTGTDYVLFGPDGNIMHVKDQFFDGPLPDGYEVTYQNQEGTYIELKDPSGNVWKGNFQPASNFKDTGRDFDFSVFDFRQHLERVQEDLRTPFVSHLHDGNRRPDPLDSTKFYKKPTESGEGGTAKSSPDASLGKKADELISGSLKRSKSYHSELGSKTKDEIIDLARKGNQAAKQMKKLIEQGERLREKVKGK